MAGDKRRVVCRLVVVLARTSTKDGGFTSLVRAGLYGT